MSNIKIAFTFILSTLSIFSHAENYVEAQNIYINNPRPLDPDSVLLAFNKFIEDDKEAIKYPNASKMIISINRKLKEVIEKREENLKWSKGIYTAGAYATPVLVAVSTPLTGGTSIAMGSFLLSVSEYYLNDRLEKLEQLKIENGRRIASTLLNEYRKEWGDSFKREFQGLTSDEVIRKLNRGKSHPIMESLSSSLTQDEQHQFELNIAHATKDLIALSYLDLQKEIDSNKSSLEENRNLVVSTQQVLDKFYNLQKRRMKEVLESQAVIKERVEELVSKLENNPDENDKNAAKVASLLLDKNVPLEDKVEIMKKNELKNPFPEQKEKLDSLKGAVETVIKTSSKLITSANDIYNIAEQVGFFDKNPKQRDKFGKILNVSNSALSAVSSFYSGNPIGAVVAVASLFRKAQPDAQALRHQEVMGAISEMRHEQYLYYSDIKSDLRSLNDNLQKGVVEIVSRLENLNKKMDEGFQTLSTSISHLHKDVIKNNMYQQLFHFDDIKSCGYAYNQILKIKNQENIFRNGRFINYEFFFNYFNYNQVLVSKIEVCRNFLIKTLASGDRPSSLFLLENQQGRIDESFIQKQTQKYGDVLKLFFELPPKMRGDMYPKLTATAYSTADIDLKYYNYEGYSNTRNPVGHFDNPEKEIIEPLIFPDMLTLLTKYTVELLPYFDLLRDGKVRTAEELAQLSQTSDRDEILRQLEALIDLSIIQQNLMSGDAFLPVFHIYLKKAPENEKIVRIQKAMRLILDSNGDLGKNFLTYLTVKQFSGFEFSPSTMYKMNLDALKSKVRSVEGPYLEAMKPFIKKMNNDLTQVMIGEDRYYNLPKVKTIKYGGLKISEQANILTKLRQEIVEIRSQNNFINRLSQEEKDFYIKRSIR